MGSEMCIRDRLRSAIQLAKASSFPKENIDRAIKKSLDKDTVNYDQMRYEGFGPNGTSIIVEALTDNRNRTASNVRSAFQKFGGSMGETGSVSHAFNHYGFVRYNKDVTSEEDFFNFSIASLVMLTTSARLASLILPPYKWSAPGASAQILCATLAPC